jgi:VWFA-related protein
MTSRWVAGGAMVLMTLVTAPAHVASGGRQAPQDPPQATFRTEANYVRVDVFPTRNGAPVADLAQSEFEVLDSGVPQKIEQFERVVVRGSVPQDARIEPSTARESQSMLENSRSRVFVLFLDTGHVDVAGSHNIRKPLVDALDRVIGVDDLVGVMTPEMSAGDIAFARKTTTIDGMLSRYWNWGERDRLNPVDPQEERYIRCYPGTGPTPACADDDRGVAEEMINRRREKHTMDALADLVRFLRGVREERKAVLTITDGWLLYQRNPFLARRLYCRVPTGPGIGVDPRGGKLTIGTPKDVPGAADCDSDRIQLSEVDDEQQFRRLLDEANRSNTSFYPIDPRGLAVFDTPIVSPAGAAGLAPAVPLAVDQKMLQSRLMSLRTLADATDGLAIVATNDIAGGLKRVVADLTSYYLLGYYSSAKLDGRFHSITVRVKRPGVQVRARRGYLAATDAEARLPVRSANARGASAGDPLALAAAAEARAIEAAIAPLEGYARPLPIRLQAIAGWKPGNAGAVWAVGELGAGTEWRGGAEVDLMLTNASGSTLAAAHARVDPGGRSFRVVLTPDQALTPGDYIVRARVKGTDSTIPSSETLRIALPDTPDATGGVFARRGPATGNKEMPTADLRFRRNEQLRVELPTPFAGVVLARLLDRTGKPLAVPVTASVQDDADGTRWQVAQLALAPLAPGDYVIELRGGPGAADPEQKRMLLAFRVVP